MARKWKIPNESQVLEIQNHISKTSDPSELYFLVKQLLKIEKKTNISRFKKVVFKLQTYLIDHDEDKDQINVVQGPGNSKNSGEELGEHDFDEPSDTSDAEYDGPNHNMEVQSHSDDVKIDGENSDDEQNMRDQSFVDPIMEAYRIFVKSLIYLTSDESVLNIPNDEFLAESLIQIYATFLESLKNRRCAQQNPRYSTSGENEITQCIQFQIR